MLEKDIINHRLTDEVMPLSDAYEGDTKRQNHKNTTVSW